MKHVRLTLQNNTKDNSLESFIENLTGDSHLRVQDDLGDGFVRLKAAEAQRRQAKQDIRSFEDVIIEMLRNSRDANAHTIFVACWKEQSFRHVTMIDDGDGIPPSLHKTVFEPFVTSKLDSFHSDRWGVHGRGMALYSIKENTDDARVIHSDRGKGAVLHVSASSETLTEKRDQSSYPVVTHDENGQLVLRGPHNILRTVMEFAIDERRSVQVYFGSPVEIAATLYAFSLQKNEMSSFSLSANLEEKPYIEWLSHSFDPDSFAETAQNLSLPLSSRSARRILDGSINPLPPYLSYLGTSASEKTNNPDSKTPKTLSSFSLFNDARGLKLAEKDIDTFKERLATAYKPLADAYYLNSGIEPMVTVKKDKITVTFEVEKYR